MNILFLGIGGVANIEVPSQYNDLLRLYRDSGHNVYIIWAIEKKLCNKTSFNQEYGVNVLRVKTGKLHKLSAIKKGVSMLMFKRLIIRAIKKYIYDITFDLIIYPTPPITFAGVIQFLKKRNNNVTTYLLLKDIFPQNALDLGLLKNRGVKGLITKYFRNKEVKLYKVSDYIGCMSQGNVDFVLRHNRFIKIKQVEVCPNCMTPTDICIDNEEKREIRYRYGIPENKTVLIYGGNIGISQGVDFIIKCLRALEVYDDIYTIIIGGGTEYWKLQEYYNSENPKNFKLMQMITREDYNVLVHSCDIGLIFLDYKFTIPNFPSRLLSYMNASIPIIAATDKNTDIGLTIQEGKFGYWCESKNVNNFIEIIETIRMNMNQQPLIGRNGREFLEQNYTVQRSFEIINDHL